MSAAGAARVSTRAPRTPPDPAHISRVPYLPGLDGMRALAVVAVMVYHANSDWLKGGFFGVEVFFVISGYLITLLLIAEKERSGRVDMKQFWLRRARRLLPALYTMMIALTLWTAVFKSDELGKLRGDVIAGFFYVSNWYQIWTGAGYAAINDFAPLRHLWSLAVEEQFYLLWPLVMVLLLRTGSRGVAGLSRWLFLAAIAVTVVVAMLYHPGPTGTPEVTPDAYWYIGDRPIAKNDALYLGTFSRASGLLLGAAFAMIWRPVAVMRGPLRDKGRALDLVALVGFVVLAAMSVTVGFVNDQLVADAWLYRGGFFVAGVATLGMIGAVTHERTATARILAMPLLVWVGTRSYGLYLFHWPIYQMIRGIAGRKLTLTEFLVAMVLTLIITELSYRFVETPIRRGALGATWRRVRNPRDRGRRRAVLAGAFAGTALTVFAAGSLATADLKQNEVAQSLAIADDFVCDVVNDPDCSGGDDADAFGSGESGGDVSDADAPAGDAGTVGDQPADGETVIVPQTTTTAPPVVIERFALGDSVMKGAAPALEEIGFVVDATESRAFVNGIEVVTALRDQNRLGDQVVIHLGTNGPISEGQMDQMMDVLADVPQVVLVTNDVDRDYTSSNNAIIYGAVGSRPNVAVLDWEGNAPACPADCFYADGIHLRPDGADYYARLIAFVLDTEF